MHVDSVIVTMAHTGTERAGFEPYLPAGGQCDVVCSAALRWHFQHSCSTAPATPKSLWSLRMPCWWPAIHWTQWRQAWRQDPPVHSERPESVNPTFGGLRYSQFEIWRQEIKSPQAGKLHYMCFIPFRRDDWQNGHLAWASSGQGWTDEYRSEAQPCSYLLNDDIQWLNPPPGPYLWSIKGSKYYINNQNN